MTHIHSWQMRYSSTAVEFPQLRQLIAIQSITYTKNEVSKNWLPETTDFTPNFVRYPTGAAACVGTLRAAATLPPSWHCAHPQRQMRRRLSAPYGQPPIRRRVGFASGSLAPCLHSATLHFARSLRSNMFSCCSFVALVLSHAIYVYLGLWVSLRLI